MQSRSLVAAAGIAVGTALAAPVPAMAATAHCDAYSHHCTKVEPKIIHRPPTQVLPERHTLAFTGGEIVLMTLVGGGAIAGGAAFAVAGRRRRRSAAA